jgi:hypothetical protein
MKKQPRRLSPREHAGILEKIISSSTTTPQLRRSAALTLARIKNKTTRDNVENLLAGKCQALDAFLVLAAQRRVLLRRLPTLNQGERVALNGLLEHMPDHAPDLTRRHTESEREHNTTWIKFVQGVITCLQAAKALPKPTTNKRKQ